MTFKHISPFNEGQFFKCGDGSVESGTSGWKRGDGNAGTGTQGWEHGDGSMGTGALGKYRDGIIKTGLWGNFFCFSSVIFLSNELISHIVMK